MTSRSFARRLTRPLARCVIACLLAACSDSAESGDRVAGPRASRGDGSALHEAAVERHRRAVREPARAVEDVQRLHVPQLLQRRRRGDRRPHGRRPAGDRADRQRERAAPLPQSRASSPSATSPTPSGITSAQRLLDDRASRSPTSTTTDGSTSTSARRGRVSPRPAPTSSGSIRGSTRRRADVQGDGRASTASPTRATPPRRRSSTTTATATSICSS